ncbi:dynamin family protein [Rhodobacter sp. NSM]|uniref:dynamin family protein n=1 Tax=Rhodobacter sp. NSM TaxID=3457501 RepID=UPI003FD32B94
MRDFADRDDVVPHGGRPAFEELESYWAGLNRIREALLELSSDAAPSLRAELDRIIERIDAFEPSVSVLGQVKAGKSTLLNALIGQPGLLPSDVNPWTSVITNVHLNSPRRPLETRALFRFFDALEWDRLVTTGGRLGEMAHRTGFEAEAEQIRTQVMQMRSTTEGRLGSDFETLLGSSHAFPDLSHDVIDRYICYGDAGDSNGRAQGFYADITKTADLFVDLPGYPQNLCIRDTPGVNDTFMMREQITINAISESRVCVIVLSAHQALSTMDMALLRIIGNVEAREVLIFVNRIDELADPVAQTKEIEASIRRTLDRAKVGAGLTILFGSALWATRALEDRCDALPEASRRALLAWTAATGGADGRDLRDLAFEASGVPELHAAISRRVVEGPGQAMLADIQAETGNVISEVETVDIVARSTALPGKPVDRPAIEARVAEVGRLCDERLKARMADASAALAERLGRAQEQFVESAVAALASHIASFGDTEGWRCDPTTLRMMIRSSYLSAAKTVRGALADCTGEAAEAYGRLLCGDLAVPEGSVAFHLPQGPVPQAPGIIAQTISLDMQTSWWRRFFQRRGSPEDRAQRYRAVISAETLPLVETVGKEGFTGFCNEVESAARAFCTKQAGFVAAVLDAMERPATEDHALAEVAGALEDVTRRGAA